MFKTISVSPAHLTKWLNEKEKNQNIIFLNFEADYIGKTKIRIDMDVAFNTIAISRGTLQKSDYYVGCRNAKVTLIVTEGEVKTFTPPISIKVDVEDSVKYTRKSGVKLAPKIDAIKNVKVELGDISNERGTERTFTYKLSGTSAQNLSTRHLHNSIEWDIYSSPEERIFRDFLSGNFYVFAESEWKENIPKKGKIVVRATDISFFDETRKVMVSRKNAIVMRFILWKQGKTFPKHELIVNFQEEV